MPQNHYKILVRAPNWIGDQILAYPFFHFLRQAYPHAHIAVACVPWVQAVQFKNLVNEVLILSKPKEATFLAKWEALLESAKNAKRSEPWDLGIALPNSFSSAGFLFQAGVKKRRGYATDGRSLLLHEKVFWNRKVLSHRAQAYVDLLPQEARPERPVSEFWGVEPSDELDPPIPGVLDSFDARAAWPDTETFEPPTVPYWVLAPGSTAESRRWPIEKFAQVARLIYEEKKWIGVIVGGPSETPLAARLSEYPELKLLDWTAKGQVTSLWKLFQNAKFSLCNDSGLAHVAALCGSPVQIVWGAGNPQRTEPIGPGKVRILFNPVGCWPCEMNQCIQPAGKKLECLTGIDPVMVWEGIKTGIRPE